LLRQVGKDSVSVRAPSTLGQLSSLAIRQTAIFYRTAKRSNFNSEDDLKETRAVGICRQKRRD
jgi:hypothetical protein